MSRGPENTFIASVHRHLPESVYRMKNHNEYNGGIADCWYDGKRGDLWIEYKFVVLPKRASTTIDLCAGKNPMLSPLQQEWLASRHANGRNVWVIAGCKEGGVVFNDPLLWSSPITMLNFSELIEDRKSLAKRITEVVGG